MTEAGPVLSMCLGFAKEPFEFKSGACGTVVRNAEMKIIHPETGVSLPRNHPGEICIRGSQIMKGKSHNPCQLFKLLFLTSVDPTTRHDTTRQIINGSPELVEEN